MRTAFVFLMLSLVLGAQTEPAPTSKPAKTVKTIDADELLKQVDKRIYYASEHGLKSFRFHMSMDHATGEFDGPLRGLHMAVAWQAPNSWKVEVVDAKGKALAKLPKVFEGESGKKLLAAWRGDIKGMAMHLMVGVPLMRKYGKHKKKVKTLEVNNKIEHKITMHPDRKRTYTEAILKIVNGIPRELTYINAKGDRFVSRFIYSQRKEHGNKWLWTGVDQEAESRKIRQEEYEYLTREKILLLSRLRRIDHVGAKRKVEFKVEGLEVNIAFPANYFPKKK